jgi:DNA repair protein RecO (recombination protein O)
MSEEKTNGIVLRSTDYKDRQRIITLFSHEAGLISLVIKGISRRNTRLLALSTPFCEGEFLFRRGTSDLMRFTDGTILNEHLILRHQLSHLQTAGSLCQSILTSQLPGKSAPHLYLLFKTYLNTITTFDDPTPLLASFQLKLLKHEGILSFEETHLTFTPSEQHTLNTLLNAQQFTTLRTLSLPSPLTEKITTLFKTSL